MDIVVIDATGSRTEEASVPSNVPAGRILAKLVELLELPGVGPDGSVLHYEFHHERTGREIDPTQSLGEAGVEDGDVLRFVVQMAARTPPPVFRAPIRSEPQPQLGDRTDAVRRLADRMRSIRF